MMKKLLQVVKLCEGYRALIILLCITLLFNGISLASSEVLRLTTAAIEKNNISELFRGVWLAIGATVFFILFDYASKVTEQKLRNNWEQQLQTQLLQKSYEMEKQQFDQIGIGEIVTKVMQNATKAVNGTVSSLSKTFSGGAVILFGLAYMTRLSPQLMIIIVTFNILFRVGTRIYDKKIRTTAKKIVILNGNSNSLLYELLNNSIIIKIFQREKYFNDKFKDKESEIVHSEWKAFGLSNSYSEIMWFTKKLAEIVLLYGYGGYLISLGKISFSVIIAFTLANDYFAKGINTLLYGMIGKNEVIPHIEAVTEFIEAKDKRRHSNTKSAFKSNGKGTKVSMERVSFSFGDYSVLQEVSFTINPGEKVQITGPNGQGKSTLLNLLLGFYQPDSGKIYYNDQPIQNEEIDHFAEAYGYISQNSHVLVGNTRDNIFLDEPVNEDAFNQLISDLCLQKVKDNQPQSYSQGEKQRISIGRALYRIPSKGLILGDEIFSNIDKENKTKIVRTLEKACQDKTVLFVCHEKMDFKFDKIIHVENGSITIKNSSNKDGF